MCVKLIKKTLRIRILSELLKLSSEAIQNQSRIILKKLLATPEFQHAKSVGLYMNMPTMEVYTQDIIKLCFEQEKLVYLPKCENKFTNGRRLEHLTFLSVASMEKVLSLKPCGKYKLREPSSGEDIMMSGLLDLLIVPGVAFSLSGQRLGHGAGYYDEFLHLYFSKFGKSPYLIGLSLLEQIVDQIPTESHDWNLDKVLLANEKLSR